MKKIIVLAKLIMLFYSDFAQTVSDYDGNIYQSIKIGEQVWMSENLKSLHYSDGKTINGVWSYNNNKDTVAVYGRLYSWEAAMNGADSSESVPSGVQGVCPQMWHLPSLKEWLLLTDHLGGAEIAGGKMKENNLNHWYSPNTGASNESEFSGLPGGYYHIDNNDFQVLGLSGFWWSTTITTIFSLSTSYYESVALGHEITEAVYFGVAKLPGNSLAYSIRCIKDEETTDFNSNQTILPDISIYPNPAKDQIIIKTTNLFEPRLNIYSYEGTLILQTRLNKSENIIDISYLKKGIYILKTEFLNGTDYKKIIKE